MAGESGGSRGIHRARFGVLMLTAFTTRRQSTLLVTFEDCSGISSAEGVDCAAFREFLAGIRLQA